MSWSPCEPQAGNKKHSGQGLWLLHNLDSLARHTHVSWSVPLPNTCLKLRLLIAQREARQSNSFGDLVHDGVKHVQSPFKMVGKCKQCNEHQHAMWYFRIHATVDCNKNLPSSKSIKQWLATTEAQQMWTIEIAVHQCFLFSRIIG